MKMGFVGHRGFNETAVTLRPPIKGRIPPINGSTPVALYQWNLLERQKPGIPLIKGIPTYIFRNSDQRQRSARTAPFKTTRETRSPDATSWTGSTERDM